MVLQEALESLFRLLVFDSGFFLFLFLGLDFISIERLFLFTQLRQSTAHTHTHAQKDVSGSVKNSRHI